MSKTVKYIIIGVVILALLFLLVYFVFMGGTPGALIAGVTGAWAVFKSKTFTMKGLSEEIEGIEEEHDIKRKEWDRIREEYDSRFNALKARMDYLDYATLKVKAQINDLDEKEREEIRRIDTMTDEERLNMLRNL
ncbi:MAG: hypothetical protein K9G67_13490 [Bacteroidales bacterium]|nr:hypothetical protein [Bacteroidales bacterium]MCF8343706.1 hypothetical protein [Bacteroidales bacterium]MCF8352347.1 hypothetical protein [Bacteroidales bacterium]MCF8377365.1 hypothetical protein [Bacteroidales bacterium]MCF8401374.1 hypothetical protein [Bacteroidales bacterium]